VWVGLEAEEYDREFIVSSSDMSSPRPVFHGLGPLFASSEEEFDLLQRLWGKIQTFMRTNGELIGFTRPDRIEDWRDCCFLAGIRKLSQ
jgi:hypothetical protein